MNHTDLVLTRKFNSPFILAPGPQAPVVGQCGGSRYAHSIQDGLRIGNGPGVLGVLVLPGETDVNIWPVTHYSTKLKKLHQMTCPHVCVFWFLVVQWAQLLCLVQTADIWREPSPLRTSQGLKLECFGSSEQVGGKEKLEGLKVWGVQMLSGSEQGGGGHRTRRSEEGKVEGCRQVVLVCIWSWGSHLLLFSPQTKHIRFLWDSGFQ